MNHRHRARRWQHGIAAVELALIMSATLVLLVPTAVIARVIWQYTVFKHATYNAARYMAGLAPAELAANVNTARQMVADELVANGAIAAADSAAMMSDLNIFCSFPDTGNCASGKSPETIQVSGYIYIADPSDLSFHGDPWALRVFTTVRYRNGEG
jgi:hypothetical protein